MTEKPNSTELAPITYQGVIIHDRQEKLSLTDMWKASGADPSRQPAQWLRSQESTRFIEFLAETLNLRNSQDEIIQIVRGGNAAGTWAHWQVALAYAKYLSPEFHVWCNTVVRERMQGKPSQQHVAVAALDADVRRIMGGVTKAVMSKALEDRLAPMEAAIMKLSDRFSTLVIEHDPRVAAVEYVSVRRLLDEAKVPPKGRNSLNRKVGNALRDLVLQTNTSALRILDADEKGPLTMRTPGGDQQMNSISEPGVYKLLGRSRKPEARRFDRWVRHEVLPSIRRHGGYMVAAPEETPEQLALRALTVLQATVERQKAQLAVAEPKAEALDRISASGDSLTMTQTAKILGMKQSDMKKWMHANRWAYPQNDSWLAYEHQIKAGRLEYKEAHYTDKETRDRHRKPYCHVTPKGLAALALLIPAKLRTEMPMFAPTLNGTANVGVMQ